MEATVLSVGKSVVDGALGYAQSAVAEEVALQLGVQRDQAFIRDELEMMQSFLMAAHDERNDNKVVKTWVKQVRDVAYDVEDCLQDFAVRLEKPSWWRIPRTLLDRRRVAKQMKELRAKVEDVSQRNVRYRLIKGSGSKPITAAVQSSMARETMFGIEEARRQQDKEKVDLVRLIKEEDKNLKVIAVWGTGGVLGQTSVIKGAYENPEIKGRFECRAWVRVMHPFNPREFLVSMVRQFNTNSLEEQDGATAVVDVLVAMEKMGHADLAHEFSRHVNVKSCLIVLNGLTNIEDWDWIKTYIPNNKNGSRIIVSIEQGEIASICVGQGSLVSELKQSSADQTIFAFYEKGSQDVTDSTEAGPSSNNSADRKNTASEDSQLIGRVNEKDDIVRLVPNNDSQQREVISVWGMGGIGKTTLVRDVYQSLEVSGMFEKGAWVTVMRPFSCSELLRSLAMQFGNKDETDLVRLLEGKRYLIVLDDLWSTTEWDEIIQHLPETAASCIIVTTRELKIARHCSNEERNIRKLKGSEDVTDSTEPGSSSNPITEEEKSLTHTETMGSPFKESKLVGRVNEKSEIITLLSKDSEQLEVISVCGMGGLGKTTLVKDVYQNQELSRKFEKRASVTVMRPFNKEELLKSLAMQLDQESPGNKEATGWMRGKTKPEDQQWLPDLLEGKKYLIVLDDVSSTTEWDAIVDQFPETQTASRIIVTTREESIAKHCSRKQGNIYKLEGLKDEEAKGLFTKKVFKEVVRLDEQYPDLAKEAKPILKKCGGLPLAIVTIGGFLANQPKTVWEWRKLNEHISAELQVNPKLGEIRTVLDKSYDGLPYHLKSCFLYLSIFPEDYKVSRKRLARRWTAEGYSREVRDKSAEKIADDYFLELKDRSMILPTQESMYSRKVVDSCQVHDVMREISISKSMEENLVFRLEEGCSSSSPGTIRHLAITSSEDWEGDKSEFESMVDLSRVRSLTVFGEWRPFFISDKMRFLRVLDLEDTDGLHGRHLKHIGKLLHLKYLSLRGCDDIYYLPDSLGNLRQLQTLDIRGTYVVKLPMTIINLRKLNFLRAGGKPEDEDVSYEGFTEDVPKLIRNRLCLLTLGSMLLCAYCSAAPVFHLGAMSSRDVCTMGCCVLLPAVAMRLDMYGVVVPRGMRKLKALHTLGVVNIARGKAVLQDIKGLTQLRKLGVTGVNNKNGKELCSAIADLRRLESLSVRSEGEPGLQGCLDVDGTPSPPENLQSLKLYGNLVELPKWIAGLKNLVKLKLRSTRLSAVAMQVLGNLPNLATLRLWSKSFEGEELHFHFQDEGFRSLVIIEFRRLEGIESVKFDQGAMPKLELLQVTDFRRRNEMDFSGLEYLLSIKEVLLNVRFERNWKTKTDEGWEEAVTEAKLKEDKLKEKLRAQLAENPKQPILKEGKFMY